MWDIHEFLILFLPALSFLLKNMCISLIQMTNIIFLDWFIINSFNLFWKNFVPIWLYLSSYWAFFFFFLHVHTREGGREIRTNDIRFIRRDLQLIDITLGHFMYIYIPRRSLKHYFIFFLIILYVLNFW